MSVRTRLTLYYTSVLGVVLLLFGIAVYAIVSYVLIRQVDMTHETTITDALHVARLDERGRLVFTARLSFGSSVILQAWDESGRLVGTTHPPKDITSPVVSIDPDGLTSIEPVHRDVMMESMHLRVFSVPVESNDGQPVGILQAGTNLAVIDGARRDLLSSLVVLGGVALTLAALGGWLSTGRALSPLEAMTRTALQITRADDLSRRIHQQDNPGDEVGQLITAFNQTLSRMEELFDSQRRFLVDVGHELRTPLTAIKGNLDLMYRMKQYDENSLSGVEAEVDRMTRLVGDLLLLAQAESGKIPLYQEKVELDTLLLEVYQQAYVLAEGKVDLTIDDIDQVIVCGDRDRLKQVIINLIDNAIKYSAEKGEVVLKLGKIENWSYFMVSDNGPGIPSEDLPYIFERFYRGEKSRVRTRDGKGFGLGLSIAYWIVHNHEGRIEVDSTVGDGTTFCVWLPLTEESCEDQTMGSTLTAPSLENRG
jgi:signal transduction histidine kinase